MLLVTATTRYTSLQNGTVSIRGSHVYRSKNVLKLFSSIGQLSRETKKIETNQRGANREKWALNWF